MTQVPEHELPRFIRLHFRSVWALEILLFLRRDPERLWTVDEVVRELRASTSLVARNLQVLERAGLVVVEQPGLCRFAPASPLIAQLCDRLEEAYRERPVAIINLISAPVDQLRQLADAFRFKDNGR